MPRDGRRMPAKGAPAIRPRTAKKYLALLLSLFSLTFALQAAEKPNVIVFMADDIGMKKLSDGAYPGFFFALLCADALIRSV